MENVCVSKGSRALSLPIAKGFGVYPIACVFLEGRRVDETNERTICVIRFPFTVRQRTRDAIFTIIYHYVFFINMQYRNATKDFAVSAN